MKNSKIEVTSFQDLLDKSEKEKEIELKYDLERNVKLVSFNKGKIDISFNEKLNKDLGTTFLFSTHDEKVMGYLDRIIHLRDGSIEKDKKVK